MFQLARETGWQRDFIVWELSLAELLLYQQAALFIEGRHWIVEPAQPVESQWETLLAGWKESP